MEAEAKDDAVPATERKFLASFDIEDWFHAENVRGSLPTHDWDQLESRLEPNVHELLDILAAAQARSTFFVLGWVADRFPGVVQRIVDEGHEVASHTYLHRNLNQLPPDEVREELRRSKDRLEQVAGSEVRGVRAPNFSISDAVLDLIAETGYQYDSSYFGFERKCLATPHRNTGYGIRRKYAPPAQGTCAVAIATRVIWISSKPGRTSVTGSPGGIAAESFP